MDKIIEKAKELKKELNEVPLFKEYQKVKALYQSSKEIKDLASWTKPKGGYFITLKVNHAKEIISICSKMGVKLTDAGATHPYHLDPTDSYIRLAPSYVSINELELAAKIIALAVKIKLS